MNFQQRSYIHDNLVIPFVKDQMENAGFSEVVTQGHEYDKSEIRQLLAKRRDFVSLMKRYKPDLLGVRYGDVKLVEVKWAEKRHPNYAIEFLSFIATKQHRTIGDVLYAFAIVDASDLTDVKIKKSQICDVNDITFPVWVIVPARPDHQDTIKYINEHFPGTYTNVVPHNNGSGTAYFLIKKSSAFLCEWAEYFNEKVEQQKLF